MADHGEHKKSPFEGLLRGRKKTQEPAPGMGRKHFEDAVRAFRKHKKHKRKKRQEEFMTKHNMEEV